MSTRLPVIHQGIDSIWMISDRLIKSADFIPMKKSWSMEQLARAYLDNVVRYHGIPTDFVFDRDSRYMSACRKELQQTLETRFNMNTIVHPITDGPTERPSIP